MNPCLPEVRTLDLERIYDNHPDRRLDRPEEGDFERLHEEINQTPPEALVLFDLRKIVYLGYSFSKHSLRKALLMRNDNRYAKRRFFLLSRLDEVVLDGINDALAQRKLLMYVVERQEDLGRAGRLVGAPFEALQETFDFLLKRAPILTGKLAQVLDTTPQNTKNRLDRLEELGLLVREKVPSESGGHEWLNRVV